MRDGRVVGFGDADKIGIVEEEPVALPWEICESMIMWGRISDNMQLTEGRIRREQDALGVTELLQWNLRKTGVHLDLIYGRDDLAVGQ